MAKCIGCEKGCEAAVSGIKDCWKCKLTGIWIYKELPEGMRLATRDDLNPEGRRMVGLKYLLKSWVSEMYEAYTLGENTDLVNIVRFVDGGRCWVKSA